MPTETLAMSAVSTPDNWTLAAGADKVVAVATDDGDTSYIDSGASANTQQQYALTNSTAIGLTDVIDSVAIRSTARRGSTPAGSYFVTAVLGASTSAGATTSTGVAYVETTDTFTSRPGGGAWTLTDVNNLEIRIENAQTRSIFCTKLDVVVTYTPLRTRPGSRLALVGVGV